ncbi:MAG: primosomal protein N' [Bacteroidaceae bacterium]|nr:primosomal protein N' [Bacteroidaceae bacterium]
MAQFADVILPLPLEGIFTYRLPAAFAGLVQVGCRIIVPFGTTKFYSAIVVRLHDTPPSYNTKEATELLDSSPVVTPAQLKLWAWIADYYLCTIGDVYKAALPSGMKLESESCVMYNEEFIADDSLNPAEEKIIRELEEETTQTLSALQKRTGIRNILPVIKRLLERDAIHIREEVKRTYKPRFATYIKITEPYFSEEKLNETLSGLKRSAKQTEVLTCYASLSGLSAALALQNRQLLREITRQELTEYASCTPGVLKALCQKGILELYQKPVGRISVQNMPAELIMHPLSEDQLRAANQIKETWRHQDVCLLHGVTSSGKTEVYIHLIKEVIEEGKQVLFMLPEIVLTAQLTDRLKKVFGDRLGVYHSRYPDGERVEVYQKMLSDTPYDIIVGVRSSVFLPFRNLGLIIIDEEHETSFKQQDPAPRYQARNVALVMARAAGAKTLLGSATPSLESYFNAETGKYGLVQLNKRYGNVLLPQIEVVDMRETARKKMMNGPFTPQLTERIREALQHGKQVILFQNRRGYAPMMECRTCGWVPRCQKCDVSLTLHRNMRQLTCHYCGASYPIPPKCPNCGEQNLTGKGYGTERIEDCLQKVFPTARIARMDLDTTRSRQRYEQIIDDFQHFRTDILVGTQMVTKGLDFEKVSVVGILNAGTMLSQPDFRSYEHAFQMMEQVAGRAGRKNEQGYVVLQTQDTEASAIRQVVNHDYTAMYREQLEERSLFNYPPYCRLIYVYMKHRDERVLDSLSRDYANLLLKIFGQRILGPDTPPIAKVQMMFIRKIIIKIELTASMAEARKRLREIQKYITTLPQYKSALIYYDVD